jgi:ATP-dependent exoDNAse (exonuclease V) beta subunit
MTAEQRARDLLERLIHPYAQNLSSGELVELANLIAECDALRQEIGDLRGQLLGEQLKSQQLQRLKNGVDDQFGALLTELKALQLEKDALLTELGALRSKEPPLLQCADCRNTESCAGAMARMFNHGRCVHCGGYFKVVRA